LLFSEFDTPQLFSENVTHEHTGDFDDERTAQIENGG
jgi:hypothetical protein